MPQFTLQGEIGSDSREVRFGLAKGFEVDREDAGWSAKLALVDHARFKLSLRGSIGDDGKAGFEVPASVAINSLLTVSTELIWTRESQTYSAGLNVSATKRLTISPIFYHDGKARAALFATWVPPGADNLQFDIGYDQQRVIVGISTAINLRKLLRR